MEITPPMQRQSTMILGVVVMAWVVHHRCHHPHPWPNRPFLNRPCHPIRMVPPPSPHQIHIQRRLLLHPIHMVCPFLIHRRMVLHRHHHKNHHMVHHRRYLLWVIRTLMAVLRRHLPTNTGVCHQRQIKVMRMVRHPCQNQTRMVCHHLHNQPWSRIHMVQRQYPM